MTKRIPKELHKKRGRPRKIPIDGQVEAEKKIGRPRKLLPDYTTVKMLEILATAHCTQAEAAAKLGVCENTFVAFLREHSEVKAAWDEGHAAGRASLRAWQFQAAEAGNTQMLKAMIESWRPSAAPSTLNEGRCLQVRAHLCPVRIGILRLPRESSGFAERKTQQHDAVGSFTRVFEVSFEIACAIHGGG